MESRRLLKRPSTTPNSFKKKTIYVRAFDVAEYNYNWRNAFRSSRNIYIYIYRYAYTQLSYSAHVVVYVKKAYVSKYTSLITRSARTSLITLNVRIYIYIFFFLKSSRNEFFNPRNRANHVFARARIYIYI